MRPWVCHPWTRTLGRLLGPCSKTGGLGSGTTCTRRLYWGVRHPLPLPTSPHSNLNRQTPEEAHTVFGQSIMRDGFGTRFALSTAQQIDATLESSAEEPSSYTQQAVKSGADKRLAATCEARQTSTLPYPYYAEISGAVSLSFQSAFHLSFTLLVRYRSRWQY